MPTESYFEFPLLKGRPMSKDKKADPESYPEDKLVPPENKAQSLRDAGLTPEDLNANTAKTKRRGLDPELQAMAKIDAILSGFGDDGICRIIRWIESRYMSGYVPAEPCGPNGAGT